MLLYTCSSSTSSGSPSSSPSKPAPSRISILETSNWPASKTTRASKEWVIALLESVSWQISTWYHTWAAFSSGALSTTSIHPFPLSTQGHFTQCTQSPLMSDSIKTCLFCFGCSGMSGHIQLIFHLAQDEQTWLPGTHLQGSFLLSQLAQGGDEHGCWSQHVSNSNSASVKHLSLLPSSTASSQPTLPHSIHHLSSIIRHQWQLTISSLLNHRLDFPNIQ